MKRNVAFTLVPVFALTSLLGYALAAAPGHGYISVPSAAFRPESHTYQYEITSGWIRNLDGDSDYYHAPLALPDGVTVTKIVFYWKDGSSSEDGYCSLWRSFLSGGRGLGMATADTSGDAGESSSSEGAGVPPSVIDNSQYAYGLTVYLPDSSVEAFGVIVEYAYTVSLPLTLRNFQVGWR
jgi:hypothetical protein